MSAVRRRIAVIITLFVAMLAMPALTTAAGAYPDGQVAGVTASASAVGQGCAVTLSGTNFFGTVTFSGAVNGTTTADANGNFSVSVDTTNLSQGQQSVTFSDNVGDTATVSFTVQSKTSACSDNNGIGSGSNGGGNNGGTGGLSNTGVAVIGIGTVGGILLAGGALMLVAGRRRKVSA